MAELARTTITIPKDLLKLAKTTCIATDKNVSQLIKETLEEKLKGKIRKTRGIMSLLGKYSLKTGRNTFRRKEIYESYLRKKISFGH